MQVFFNTLPELQLHCNFIFQNCQPAYNRKQLIFFVYMSFFLGPSSPQPHLSPLFDLSSYA